MQLLRAEHGLVADDDAVDIPVLLGERDGSLDLALVLLFPFVDPHAERDAQADLGGELRHAVEAVAHTVGPDRTRKGSDRREI